MHGKMYLFLSYYLTSVYKILLFDFGTAMPVWYFYLLFLLFYKSNKKIKANKSTIKINQTIKNK